MKLYAIKDKDIYDQFTADVSSNPGCYVLCCHDNSGFFKIYRTLGADDTGTLYIESATSLRQRVSLLRTALCAAVGRDNVTNKKAHGCGLKYNELFQRQFPFEALKVILYPTNSNEEAWKKEGELLADYENRFDEAPPFNEGRSKGRG
jgi:hypothetical protein